MTSELFTVLKSHCDKYPEIQPQDIYKLLYQSEFGPKHFMVDKKDAEHYLIQELKDVSSTNLQIEEIGSGFIRFYLFKDMDITILLERFVQSSQNKYGSNEHFKTILRETLKLIPQLNVCFSSNAFETFICEMANKCFPDVHHSVKYKEMYNPHYRVILK